MKTIKNILLAVAASSLTLFVLVHSASLSKGISIGIQICINNLIPSLFFFMVLCSFFMESGIGQKIFVFLIRPLSKLFCVSPVTASVFCFSLLGGFPVGAKLLADSVKREEISPQEAESALAYCVNCGPAFLISAVSVPIFHNYTIGIVVYCSQVLAALTIGIISRKHSHGSVSLSAPTVSIHPPQYSNSFISAVRSTVQSMGIICALVLLFSGISQILKEIGFMGFLSHKLEIIMTSEMANSFLTGLLEVTAGCNALQNCKSLTILILITGFGGVCIQLQIKAIIGNLKMNAFYFYRLPYIFFSWFYSMIFIRIFGGTIVVFSQQDQMIHQPYTVSPFFTVLLIILSVLLLLSVPKSDTMK